MIFPIGDDNSDRTSTPVVNYLLIAINEDDADEVTRDRFCSKTQDASCRISTPEQLFVFARATAAKDDESGGIAVIVPSERR